MAIMEAWTGTTKGGAEETVNVLEDKNVAMSADESLASTLFIGEVIK